MLARLLVAALLLALPGCALLERAPPVVVKNETTSDLAGEVRLYEGDELVARWGFSVPALAHREVARLPRAQAEHRILVELEDGRSAQGDAQSGAGEGQVLVRVSEAKVVVEPQRAR